MMRSRRIGTHGLLAGWLLVIAVGSSPLQGQRGQSDAPTPGGPARLSGFWELAYESLRIPPASLMPAVTRAVIADHGKRDVHALRWCHTMGLPIAMVLGRPLEIRVGQREVYVVFEANAAVRHIYLNRKAHINAEEFDPTTNGDSIGQWEGDTFVVDTVGFHGGRGVTAIPGGGFRTDKSRMTERFRVRADGTILSVVTTWTDPDVFRSPHTYELRYSRLPDSYEPRPALPCDAYDADRVKYVDSLAGVALPAANASASTTAKPVAAPARGGRRGAAP